MKVVVAVVYIVKFLITVLYFILFWTYNNMVTWNSLSLIYISSKIKNK